MLLLGNILELKIVFLSGKYIFANTQKLYSHTNQIKLSKHKN